MFRLQRGCQGEQMSVPSCQPTIGIRRNFRMNGQFSKRRRRQTELRLLYPDSDLSKLSSHRDPRTRRQAHDVLVMRERFFRVANQLACHRDSIQQVIAGTR